MKRMIKYPSIEQFRTIIKNVQHAAQYVRYDEATGQTIMNRGAAMPVVKAVATEKIHGTNASVCFSNADGFWVQKREGLCTLEEDNAACAFYAMQNQSAWMDVIERLAKEHNVNLDTHIISVYYEWCGGNIQKNSAVSGLDKLSIIFRHFKVSPIEPSETESAVWFETKVAGAWVENKDARIFNISNFPTYEIEIDFNQPLLSQNKMVDLVENTIEPNSPVGRQFGIDGNVGEGVVVSFLYKDCMYQFKVKGEKHSASKVKVLKPVDDEKLQKIQEVAQQVTPAWRLEQMFALANDTVNGGVPAMENMGKFMKAVNTDIIKEESDTLAGAGLEPKEVFSVVARIARQWYSETLDGLVFNQ